MDGGSSDVSGLLERLKAELEGKAPEGSSVDITACEHGENQAFIGASILGSIGTFESKLITKEEFENQGPAILQFK